MRLPDHIVATSRGPEMTVDGIRCVWNRYGIDPGRPPAIRQVGYIWDRKSGLLFLFCVVLLCACGGKGNGEQDIVLSDERATVDSSPPESDCSSAESGCCDLDRCEEPASTLPFPFDWCLADEPPDESCYAQKRNPNSENVALALAIAERQMALHPPESLKWNWEEATLLLGMIELYRVTGNVQLQNYCKGYIDHHKAKGFSIGTSDTCVPAAVAIALASQLAEAGYEQVGEEALHYLYEVAKRTPEGGISHLGIVDIVTLWVDSLFMFGQVFIRWSELSGEKGELDAFGEQFSIFAQLLQGEEGLFTHAWNWILDQTKGVYWARGNGWVLASGYDYLRLRRNRGEADASVQESLAALAEAVIATQEKDSGLWWTIINRPGEIYLETSASALFAYGLARGYRYGYLDESVLAVARKAVVGVKSRIVQNSEGGWVVTGISGPTSAGPFSGYAAVKLADDLPFGIGAVLLALVETSGLPDSQER